MRAAIYLRVSREDQADPDRYSIPTQRHECRALIARRGWEFIAEYADEGASAYLDGLEHRPYFRALLQDAQEGRFDIVVVYAIDRFARNMLGAQNWLDTLQKAGVQLASVTEGFDESPSGEFVRNVLLAQAQFSSQLSSEKIKSALEERGRRGYWRGDPPFGYCRGQCHDCTDVNGEQCPRHRKASPLGSARELHPHPVDSKGVELAFTEYAYRAETYRDVAEVLNAAGYRTRNKKGGGPQLFSGGAVQHILKNPLYIGRIRIREPGVHPLRYRTMPGNHPAIVGLALWERVQAKIARIPLRPPRSPRRANPWPLTIVARCARCGSTLCGQAGGVAHEIRYYSCSRSKRFGRDVEKGGCDLPSLRADACEQLVGDKLSSLRLPEKWQEAVLKRLKAPKRPGPTLEALEGRLERLTETYEWGHVSKEQYSVRRARILAQMAEVQRPPAQVDVLKAGELLADIGTLWKESPSVKDRRRLLASLFVSLVFDGERSTTPQLVDIVPKPDIAPVWDILCEQR